jgi:hypothetical protein
MKYVVVAVTLALLCPSVSLAAAALTGGRVAKFQDEDGTKNDRASIKFVREAVIAASLPDPTVAASTIRMWSDKTDTGAVILDVSRWRPSPGGYVYKFPTKANPPGGIFSVIFKSRARGGKLVIKAGGDAYGANAVFGPAAFVQIEFAIGPTTYAGRFQSPPAVVKSNAAEKVVLRGRNASLPPTNCQTASLFPRPFVVDPEDYPFDSCAFDSSAGRIHYFDEGPRDASETVLLIHGNPTWSFLYRNIATAMIADGRRVVALDHLGMGMSNAPSTSDVNRRGV